MKVIFSFVILLITLTISLLCTPHPKVVAQLEPEYLIKASDTCNGPYEKVIEELLSTGLENSDAEDIRLLRCLKMNAIKNRELKRDSTTMEFYKKALNENNSEKIIEYGKMILKSDIVDIWIHDKVAASYKRLGDTEKFEIHADFIAKYLVSFSLLGDGTSMSSPLQVFYTREEYDYTAAMNLKRKSRKTLSNINGRSYEIWTCQNREGNEVILHFDITSYMFYLQKEFERGNKSVILF